MTDTLGTVLDQASLVSLTHAPSVPFRLPVETGVLHCSKVLRFLPGKRLVVQAELGERKVIAKCFYGPKAQKYMQRELQGIKGFIASGADTPELITHQDNPELSLVITRLLDPACSFEQVWNSELGGQDRRKWLTRIACTLATMHKAGVYQDDIHLDNLLVQDEHIFLIDGGGARVEQQALPQQVALANLALFQAVLFPRYDRYLPDIWQAYIETAPEYARNYSAEKLALLVQQKRKWRERFIQKSLRNCTRFKVEKNWSRFVSVDRQEDSPALRELLADPETFIEAGKVLKRGSTNTVAITTLNDGQKVFIKRYKSTKGFLHKYLRGFRQSRARQSWLNGHLLEMLGIDTPKPLAMMEYRCGPLVTCSYIFNRFEESDRVLDWFQQKPLPENHKAVALRVYDILQTLRRALVFHGDLKATNILLVNEKPLLIDLDAMTSFKNPKTYQRYGQVDKKRFTKNWLNSPAADVFQPLIDQLR